MTSSVFELEVCAYLGLFVHLYIQLRVRLLWAVENQPRACCSALS
jgi:hypothetical protein